MKIEHNVDYRDKRRAEYPDIGDQLDALWHALSGTALGKIGEEMRARIQAVKAKYPKP